MKTPFFIGLFIVSFVNLFAQKNDYVKGQILVHLVNTQDVTKLTADFALNQTPEQLAPSFAIFRLFVNENQDEKTLLYALRKHPSVLAAQFNHILEDRATPNDTRYAQQWHHNNPGGSPAVADADMDTDDAWNITKGGITTDGDSIVVAVIDNGTNLQHPDLQQNLWFNRREIPDNGIDDDQNGYIDDFRGWNAAVRNDVVDGGTHGVEVEGVIGAVGNNNRGVAGVNWSVKIMSVVYDGSEASVIASYAYVFAQRKLYNATQGKRGAFVVATNSSFGSPNRFPNDAPLWCAMYDSLGKVGILSFGATANNNVDVDQVGDLPSTCPSDYLVVVTATDNRDVKATDAAFGVTHVDVAAPGVGIWTTSPNGDYTAVRGTSLACPMVAGIAALAYAVPCSDFINFAKRNPTSAALFLKDWILRGAESKIDLMDKIKTGGRVNAFLTIQKVAQYCGACPQPANVKVSATTNSAQVSMVFMTTATTLEARYRSVGATIWTPIAATTAPLSISGLQACTFYELEIKVACTGVSSPPLVVTFRTDGCCSYPENVLISKVLENQITVQVSKVTASTGYRVCLKETTTGVCAVDKTFTDTTFIVNSLKKCQNYQVSVQTLCANNVQSKDTLLTVRTKGCGTCYDSIYCRSSGSTTSEWIDSFSVADFKFFSGKNGGYARFDTVSTTLLAGKTYPVSLKPNFSGSAFTQGARVWIDLNQDGDFDDAGEQIFEFPRFSATTTGTITIPTTAKTGIALMRVSMKYVGFSGIYPTACESFSGGEVEDFCIRLDNRIPTQDILRGQNFTIFPNPFSQFLTIRNAHFDKTVVKSIEVLSLEGRSLYVKQIENLFDELTLTDLPPLSMGVYFIKIQTEQGIWVSKIVRN
ncbi:MAG: S8 family peptidase [Saprospiraceae bacterium]|nr:S8 family peptidase [Saprospiraceae bacterium]